MRTQNPPTARSWGFDPPLPAPQILRGLYAKRPLPSERPFSLVAVLVAVGLRYRHGSDSKSVSHTRALCSGGPSQQFIST